MKHIDADNQINKIKAEIHRLKRELEGYSAQEGLDYLESYINLISREYPLPDSFVETRIVKAEADYDPHGADYGIRYLKCRIEDDTPIGTKYIVQIRRVK